MRDVSHVFQSATWSNKSPGVLVLAQAHCECLSRVAGWGSTVCVCVSLVGHFGNLSCRVEPAL